MNLLINEEYTINSNNKDPSHSNTVFNKIGYDSL